MEKEKIITLLYNFYTKGYEDGYDADYEDYDYGGSDVNDLNSLNYQGFCDWCEKYWEEIKFYSENICPNGFTPPHLEEFFKEKEKSEIIKRGIKQYISDRYNNSYGIEKTVIELFLTRYINAEYTVKKLQEFVDSFICFYDLDNGMREGVVKNCLVEASNILEKRGINIKDLIGNYVDVNDLKTVVNISFNEAFKIKMQEFVDEIKNIFGEE